MSVPGILTNFSIKLFDAYFKGSLENCILLFTSAILSACKLLYSGLPGGNCSGMSANIFLDPAVCAFNHLC